MLRAKLKAHSASLTAALVVVDEPGVKEIATASLDKTLATWRIEPDLEVPSVAAQRSEVAGAPVFSLVSAARQRLRRRRRLVAGRRSGVVRAVVERDRQLAARRHGSVRDGPRQRPHGLGEGAGHLW